MRKRLYLESIQDNLARDMWGDIIEKVEYFKGLVFYRCKFYKGFIVNDRDFTINKELKKNLNPMTIIETYTFRKERFIVERTDPKERIPKKLMTKYNHRRYDDCINIYALTEESMDILKYYHSEILKLIYEKKWDLKSKEYKSDRGYINSEMREIRRHLALNAPEFVKKKDKKKAQGYLEKEKTKRLTMLEKVKNPISQDVIELENDKILQRIEVLCVS